MSTTMYDTARTSQEQFLATIRQSQDAVVEAVAAWAKAVESVAPSAPNLPASGDLPRPEAVVENAFDFAQKLLDAQRDFARQVISAAAPAQERAGGPNA